ncbi:hypothetical protein Q3G72_013721 [Acer saccharum]|nr:hypothetical protein Q3G72_013721 [Acer saccharum]
MLPFQIFVKYVDETVDLDIIKPRDCSVISLINDAKKELKGGPIEPWGKWQLAITLPWNGVHHEGFNGENVPPPEENVQHHDDEPVKDAASEPVEHVASESIEDTASEPVEQAASDEIDGSEDDNNYDVVNESEDDSDDSLVEEDRVDFGNPDHCNPDSDESIIILSSDEENGLTRAARYC